MKSAFAFFAVAWVAAAQPGQPLPRWTPGTLDIHQINTGRGNAGFLIFPDGTTMLLDAGDGGRVPPRGTPPKPDASRKPGEWIARYIRAALADTAPTLDYIYLTHFHDDHMDGLPDVGAQLAAKTIIDRGWPTYDYPNPITDDSTMRYRAFIENQREKNGANVERLIPGRADQIVLRREPGKYPNFVVRNIAANGEVWTGEGSASRKLFPDLKTLAPADYPTENMCSLAVRISYGKFDYFSGGDMPGNLRPGYPAWQDVETAVGKAVGTVDAAILNHHGNRDSQNAAYVSALQPQVWVIPVWSSDHPGHDVLDRMYSQRLYPGTRDVFATNMIEANRQVIGDLLNRLKSSQGHIVIRVAPGGDEFRVLILDDSTEGLKVKAEFGPYRSR